MLKGSLIGGRFTTFVYVASGIKNEEENKAWGSGGGRGRVRGRSKGWPTVAGPIGDL